MLQRIRDKITGWVAIAIIAIIAVTFIFFGVNMQFTRGGFIAKVNGVDVSPLEVQRVYQNQTAQLREQLGRLPPELDRQIQQNALETVITGTVLRTFLAERGYRIADATVQQSIREIPLFREDDKFSYELYRQELAARGYTPSQFERDQRDNLRLEQLQQGIAATGFVTPSELRRYIELENETRTLAYAEFDPSGFETSEEPDDAEIAAYYEANSARFQTEASASIAYVELTRDVVADQIEVTDEALQSYYESVAESFRTAAERNPRHILIPLDDDEAGARELAATLLRRIESGETFEELARQYSKDGGSADQGGDLGWVRRGQFVGPVDDAVFSMSEGEVRGPIESEFGLHLIRLDGIREESLPEFAEVRERVERQFRDERAAKRFLDVSNRLADALFDDPDLDALAESQGLEIREIDQFTRADAALFQNNPQVIDSVFGENAVRDDALSDLIEIADDRLVVLRVDDFRPAAVRPLDAVRDEIVAELKAEEARIAAAAAAAAALSAVRAGETLEQAAADTGGRYVDPVTIGRDDTELPAGLKDAVFAARAPGAAGVVHETVTLADGTPVVLALSKVEPGRATEMSVTDRDSTRRRLIQQNGLSDFGAFVSQLRNNADVTIGTAQFGNSDENF